MIGFWHGRNTAPVALSLGQNCQGWNQLPEAGGYLDQDYKTMTEMNIALNIYSVVNKVKNAKGAAIHQLTNSERKILKPLVEQGLI